MCNAIETTIDSSIDLSLSPKLSVDRYNPEENRWTRVAFMTSARLCAGVAVLNNVLYVIGGSNGSDLLKTCEKYDPETNIWTPIASK